MNQIIYTPSSNISKPRNRVNNKNLKKKILFKAQFTIIMLALISILAYYIYFRIDIMKKEKISKNLAQSFGITKIYQDSNDYTATRLNQETILNDDNAFSVIGLIKIDKLNISYPILENISTDALKIGICHFDGPMPNEVRKYVSCWA